MRGLDLIMFKPAHYKVPQNTRLLQPNLSLAHSELLAESFTGGK